ncbi:hypothetical protein Tco_1145324 [Tanacetum coccineum]
MADNRTMAQLLEAPIEGYEDAIVVPEITADNFELKHGLLTLRVDDMLSPSLIAKDLSIEEKKRPSIKVLKSNKASHRLETVSDIKGIDPGFCNLQDSLWKETIKRLSNIKDGESKNPRCHQKGG